ncbi:FAR1 DNA binding domain [Macleaya cordata]|uniref:FAR1 DNA binding domain n=1 Tax=Macleaya cordata TaxID=56857 RepID=A0A200RCK3_MACCD|nr:FAR1 DNA binding domain [Macleaya cordata]
MSTSENIEPIDKIQDIDSNKKSRIPSLGTTFSSIEEAYECYQDYGRRMGMHRTKSDTSDGTKKKRINTSTMRTNCKARLRIALDPKLGEWFVKSFVEEHNHALLEV